MKKFLSLALIFGFLSTQTASAQEAESDMSPENAAYEKAMQEAKRNKELLEIWKDHVRTLTRERDEAFKQVETLKSNPPAMTAGPAHFGKIEVQPLATSGEALKTIEGLRSQVTQLKSELAQRPGFSAEEAKDIQTRFAELASQNQRLQKELAETRNDRDLIIKEKEKALGDVSRLTTSTKALESERAMLKGMSQKAAATPPAPAKDASYQYLENSFNSQKQKLNEALAKNQASDKELLSLRAKLNQLQGEMASLKSLESQIQTVENSKESQIRALEQTHQELRTGLESKIQSLEKDNRFLQSSLASKEDQNRLAASDKVRSLESQIRALEQASQDRQLSLEAKIQSLEKNNQFLQSSLASNENQNNLAYSEKIKSQESLIQKLENSNQGLRATLAAKENQAKAADSEKVASLESKIQMLQESNEELGVNLESLKRTNQALQASIASKENQNNLAASAKMKSLESQLQTLEKSNQELKSALASKDAQKETVKDQAWDDLIYEREDALKEARELKYQNDTLKVKADKLAVVQKELDETRVYLTSVINELQTSNKSLSADHASLQQSIANFEKSTQAQEEQLRALSKDLENSRIQNQTLQATIGKMETELKVIPELRNKLRAASEETQQIQAENASLKDKISQTDAALNQRQDELDDARLQSAELKRLIQEAAAEKKSSEASRSAMEEALQIQKDKLQSMLMEKNRGQAEFSEQMKAIRLENEEVQKQFEAELQTALMANAALEEQVNTLESRVASLQLESQKVRAMEYQYDKLKLEHEAVKKVYKNTAADLKTQETKILELTRLNDEATDKLGVLKAEIQLAEADRAKAKATETEMAKVLSENDSLKKSYEVLKRHRESQSEKLETALGKITELEKTTQELHMASQEQIKTIENLKSSLHTNLADIQNLKTNFESYLESLVTSFQDRQK